MSSLANLLKEVIHEHILKEIGDGGSKPYSFSANSHGEQYSFIAEFPWGEEEVQVDFDNFSLVGTTKKEYILPQRFWNSKNTWNVGYKVGGDEFQFEKSDLKSLVRILSTLVLIIKDFIEQNDPDLLYLEGNLKNQNQEKSQKNTLYQAYLWKNIDKLSGYSVQNRREGYIIFKTNFKK